jgi:hypothetical protein
MEDRAAPRPQGRDQQAAETNRHAGHADIVRETIDGRAGMRPAATNLPDEGDQWWLSYREKLQRVANGYNTR